MSRTYKKYPSISGGGCKKWAKREANKKVRRTQDIACGKSYCKVFNSWDIMDWNVTVYTKQMYYYEEEDFRLWMGPPRSIMKEEGKLFSRDTIRRGRLPE